MSAVESLLLRTVFRSKAMAEDAAYYAPGEAAGAGVRAILTDNLDVRGFSDASVRDATVLAEVRDADLPAPRAGGHLVLLTGRLAGKRFRVSEAPERDASGVWTLPLAEVRRP